MPDEPNTDEGADPSDDIKAQNPGEKTTGDQSDNGSGKTQELTNTEDDDDLAQGSE